MSGALLQKTKALKINFSETLPSALAEVIRVRERDDANPALQPGTSSSRVETSGERAHHGFCAYHPRRDLQTFTS